MSKLWEVSKNEVLHGLMVAVATAVLTLMLQMLSAGVIDWRQLGIAAISTTLAYILKVLSSDENGKIGGRL